MKMTHVGSLCVAVIAAFAGGLARPAHAAEVRPAIEAANAQFSAMAAKRDAAGLAALYATDGQLLPAGSDVIRGRGEMGQYELHDAAGKVLDRGKYIVIWRHEGHDLRLLRDMFSANASPAKK
jgi:hypothetical protein